MRVGEVERGKRGETKGGRKREVREREVRERERGMEGGRRERGGVREKRQGKWWRRK